MRVVRHRVKTYPDVAKNVPKDTKTRQKTLNCRIFVLYVSVQCQWYPRLQKGPRTSPSCICG
jgi:hypothetical protein